MTSSHLNLDPYQCLDPQRRMARPASIPRTICALGTLILLGYGTAYEALAQSHSNDKQYVQILLLDSLTGRPVRDVFVQAGNSNDISNEQGIARLRYAPQLQLRISHLAYRNKALSLRLKPGTKRQQILLVPSNTQLREVAVYGSHTGRSISVDQQIRQEEILSNMGKTLASALSTAKGGSHALYRASS